MIGPLRYHQADQAAKRRALSGTQNPSTAALQGRGGDASRKCDQTSRCVPSVRHEQPLAASITPRYRATSLL